MCGLTQENFIELLVFEEYEEMVAESFVLNVCSVVFQSERIFKRVGVVIADDETVHELNLKYRGLDKTTDVLSFGFTDESILLADNADGVECSTDQEFILPDTEPESLGEVIISFPQVMRQAQDLGRKFELELAHLIVHGILHLTGQDHVISEDQLLMEQKEDEILRRLELNLGDIRNG